MSTENLPANIPNLPDSWKDKLANTLNRVVDHFIEIDPLAQAESKAKAMIIKAKAEAEVSIIKEQGIAERALVRLRNRELRRQKNIEAIAEEAFKALPPPTEPLTEAPVSEDFVEQFFEECQDVSDSDMQKIWGRLMAGEVARPGSFHPTTMRILRYMTKNDAALFSKLCSFKIKIANESIPLVFFHGDDFFYKMYGVNFELLSHLNVLGLINFSGITGFKKTGMPSQFQITYGDERYSVVLQNGQTDFVIGNVLFTQSGTQLAGLTQCFAIPQFPEYFITQWNAAQNAVVSKSSS